MFLDFYHLKEQPFGVTPDPRFLYLGRSHREALASLYYGIEAERGFITLIAPPGMGKTTLSFQLLERLQRECRTVFLFQTQCNYREFFGYLLNGLGVDSEGMELVSMHNRLNQILTREMLAGRRFILAIDEAQNLEPEVLEAVRLLSNFETSRNKMLQILLIGQPQLARKLASPELEQFRQRVSSFAHIEAFSPEETASYITHRLQVAGHEGDPLFSVGALRLIAEHSQGVPRKINGLCFGALSLCCAMDREQVNAEMIEEVVADSSPASSPKPKEARRIQPSTTSFAARSLVSSYAKTPSRRVIDWVRISAGAACIAVAIGVLAVTLGWTSLLTPSSVGPAEPIPAGTQIDGALPGEKYVPNPPSLNVQAAELPPAAPAPQPSAESNSEVNTVTVRRGETLREVILRTLGVYDRASIEVIRNLNPDITDINHVEPGQVIRYPKMTTAVRPAVTTETPAQ